MRGSETACRNGKGTALHGLLGGILGVCHGVYGFLQRASGQRGHSRQKAWAHVFLATAGMAFSAQEDFLLEFGAAPVIRTVEHHALPNLGTQISVLKGIDQRTDLGFLASWDRLKGKSGAEDLDIFSLGIQGWLSGLSGKLRPQMGATMGISLDSEVNASLHLAARARGIAELSTRFFLYTGVALGGDIGDHGNLFGRGEFGARFSLL